MEALLALCCVALLGLSFVCLTLLRRVSAIENAFAAAAESLEGLDHADRPEWRIIVEVCDHAAVERLRQEMKE